jgi:hypothetical protein
MRALREADSARQVAADRADSARRADADQAAFARSVAERAAQRGADSTRLATSFRPWVACVRQVLRGDTLVTEGEMQAACRWPKSATEEQFRRWSNYERPKDRNVLQPWAPKPEPF